MRIASLALLSLVTFVSNAQFNTDKKVLFDKKTFPLSAIKNLDLATSGGAIYAEGVSNGEAILEVYVGSNRGKTISLDEAKAKLADGYTYTSGLKGSTLFAEAKRKNSFFGKDNGINISYRVIVPITTSSNLKTSGGSIQIKNLKGNESIATSGGSLAISKIQGNLNANTSGGSIDLGESSGKLQIHTSGGSLNMNDLSGSIEALTSGGSISANNIEGSLTAKTSGGSISFSNIAATTDASTSGGSINAEFKDPGKGIILATSGGGVHISVPKTKGYDVALHGTSVNINNATVSGTKTKSSVDGKINGGGIPVNVSTSAGGVTMTLN